MARTDVITSAEPAGTTLDAFLEGRIKVFQPRSGYRAGLDAVLLAAAVNAQAGQAIEVADLGAGVGTVGLCIAARIPCANVVLVEKAPVLAALADANIAANGFAERMCTVCADLTSMEANLGRERYDTVVANPPYQTEGEGRAPPDPLKAGSHMMDTGGMDRWLRCAAGMVKPRGTLIFIHKVSALPELLSAFKGRFGAIRVLPVHPRAGQPANRVLVSGIKGSRAPLQMLPGLIVHSDAGHEFTPAARAILRDGASLIAAQGLG